MGGYLDFKETGSPLVDDILGAVECAGSMYHHTEFWGDPVVDGKPSPNERIEEAATKAATRIEALEADNAKLRGLVGRAAAHLDSPSYHFTVEEHEAWLRDAAPFLPEAKEALGNEQ